ncbi:MAG TPA: hypothetical protein VEL72_00860 [Ktedonobacteraceae bacterium]|nr:hypothetical protein [Ktedonobacteraceae bacterium]
MEFTPPLLFFYVVKHTPGIPVSNLHELLLLRLFYPLIMQGRDWFVIQLANETITSPPERVVSTLRVRQAAR